jgi:putative addiction module component (TIGR02574 family)
MSVISEIEELVFRLPVADRARLANRLWESIPEDFIDDEELQEAVRRDLEMDADPSKVLSHDQFFGYFKERRR